MYMSLNRNFIQISQNSVTVDKIIGPGNGLVPIRQQVITFTNVNKTLTSHGINGSH